tara:strand:+ start:611 stop:793 length:183 start_codon:yes stop_codon:yes gene_type:complete
MVFILIWNNDGSFHSSVSEVKKCPEVGIIGAVMEEQRMSGSFKSWVVYCQQAPFAHDIPI